jgi:hypothetical protein
VGGPRASAKSRVSVSWVCGAEEDEGSGGVAGVAAQGGGDVAVAVCAPDLRPLRPPRGWARRRSASCSTTTGRRPAAGAAGPRTASWTSCATHLHRTAALQRRDVPGGTHRAGRSGDVRARADGDGPARRILACPRGQRRRLPADQSAAPPAVAATDSSAPPRTARPASTATTPATRTSGTAPPAATRSGSRRPAGGRDRGRGADRAGRRRAVRRSRQAGPARLGGDPSRPAGRPPRTR